MNCLFGCLLIKVFFFIDIEQNPIGWRNRRDGLYCILSGLGSIK